MLIDFYVSRVRFTPEAASPISTYVGTGMITWLGGLEFMFHWARLGEASSYAMALGCGTCDSEQTLATSFSPATSRALFPTAAY